MTKKFANLHYPGMKSDPNEGRVPLSEQAAKVFEDQIKVIGEDAQRDLAGSSVLVLGASPLGVRVARRLLEAGFGRVGLFGEQTLSSAHLLKDPDDVAEFGAIDGLKRQIKELWSWSGAGFEPFSKRSLDRQFDDIARGFQWYVVDLSADNEHVPELAELFTNAKKYGAGLIAARVMGAEFRAQVFAPSVLEKTSPEKITADFTATGDGAQVGVFYAALDLLAARISHALALAIIQGSADDVVELQ